MIITIQLSAIFFFLAMMITTFTKLKKKILRCPAQEITEVMVVGRRRRRRHSC